ncbi:adenylyl-sulfate kinase [Paludifilum halophilum]|uniref:Adenylyl-sulfate kinase n=1 Tax=Paludifilum halophilum TaxID=1642702 RepID=A0A235BB87_9BACL|nr:adenylyl-sulfate kinase [Paludifilum halophilum]OYD09570.1 adenylyl-sulfate kinase [Paludifilum halophilum]
MRDRRCDGVKEQKGVTLWLTGLSGAGKTTIACILEQKLKERGLRVERLDGDVVRTHLTKDLGFSKEDRCEHIERVTYVAELLTRHGVIVLASFISPYRSMRAYSRKRISSFVEVYVHCPLEECIRRDVKGLYEKAMKGGIPCFTGINDPYEAPENPDLTVNTQEETPEESAERVLRHLECEGWVSGG